MLKKPGNFPDVVEKTEAEIDYIITVIKNSAIPDDIKLFIIKCIELAMWLPNFVLNTKISMRRFSTMIFGKGYRNNHPNTNKGKSNSSTNGSKKSKPDSNADSAPDRNYSPLYHQ